MRNTRKRPSEDSLPSNEKAKSYATVKAPFCDHGCRRLEGGFIACQPDCETHARLGLWKGRIGKTIMA